MTTTRMEVPRGEHHEHGLTLVTDATTKFTCNGCREDGYHLRYACRRRGHFHLHEACAQKLGDLYRDPFNRRGGFVFLRSLPATNDDDLCHACGGKVNGYVYVREGGAMGIRRRIVLHPCCAALPPEIEEGGAKLRLRKKLRSRCCKCDRVKLGGGGRHTWGYVSAAGDIQLHVACANELFREEYERALRQESRAARFMARLRRALGGGGGGELSNAAAAEGTGGSGGAAGSATAANLPELPIRVPAATPRRRRVADRALFFRAVWRVVCTVGAVIAGDPISMSMLLLELFAPSAAPALTG